MLPAKFVEQQLRGVDISVDRLRWLLCDQGYADGGRKMVDRIDPMAKLLDATRLS